MASHLSKTQVRRGLCRNHPQPATDIRNLCLADGASWQRCVAQPRMPVLPISPPPSGEPIEVSMVAAEVTLEAPWCLVQKEQSCNAPNRPYPAQQPSRTFLASMQSLLWMGVHGWTQNSHGARARPSLEKPSATEADLEWSCLASFGAVAMTRTRKNLAETRMHCATRTHCGQRYQSC